MRFPLVLLCFAAACGPPEPPAVPRIDATAPETYYVGADRGRVLYFDQAFVNRADSTLVLYAFAYAADNVAQPPARAVYPPRALASMPHDRRFAVADPGNGLRFQLAPGDTGRFRGALAMPTTWPDGRPIASEAFRDFSLYLYGADGRNVYRHTWPLAGTAGATRQ